MRREAVVLTKQKVRMRLLITGATGFIGAAAAHHCRSLGFQVRTAGRSSEPCISLEDYHRVDIRDRRQLNHLCNNVDCVVHAAGLAHQFGATGHQGFYETNVQGTEAVAQAAVRAGVNHFVLVSSVSVYGTNAAAMVTEDSDCRPHGPYAVSKYLAEHKARDIAASAGMRLTILRLATVYGEEDPGNMARLMGAIDRRRFVWVGHGNNLKSLIHRDDVARAFGAVVKSGTNGDPVSVYNLSSEPCTMREVVEGLAEALGRRLPRWHIPAGPLLACAAFGSRVGGQHSRAGKLHASLEKWVKDDSYDPSRFKRRFDFQPQVVLREGLRREVEWYRSSARA